MTTSPLLRLAAILAVSACASTPSPTASAPPASSAPAPSSAPAAAPEPGGPEVPDMAAFQAFIAKHPTMAAFHAAYPKVQLVEPGMITTDEMRACCGRYFATYDDKGNITGGSFH